MNIKIVTNYQNSKLYSISKSFYEDLEFECIGLNGSNGFYGINCLNYIMTDKLFNNVDWVIYIDEDCFITNKNAMLELLYFQIENNIHCSGMPDGGVVRHRQHNPISINAFFTILHLSELKKKYNSDVMLSMKYNTDLNKYIPHTLINKHLVNYDDFEPTYKLFFWLLRNNYNLLYLNAKDLLFDNYTTILENHLGVDFAYHTWFARKFNTPEHNNRILNVINYCKTIKK